MCALLAASMLTTGVVAVQSTASAATVENESGAEVTTEASYALADSIENGNILHCFNWKLSDIQAELPNIAAAGYTSVQTSPLQGHDNSGAWYWIYQPTNFNMGNELGDMSALQSLCAEADKYGIKVIVDVVANHVAGWNDGRINDGVDSNIKNNSSFFHNQGGASNWDDRNEIIYKNIGMPDLASENEGVQNMVSGYIDSLINAGVDGFRWDAAKHINLPSEGNCNFWKMVAGKGVYNYGEILDGPAGNNGGSQTSDYNKSLIKEYTQYIGVTDAIYSGTVTGAVRDGGVPDGFGNWTGSQTAPANRMVYWAESHDTYANDGGWTKNLSTDVMNRAYAIVACRNGSQALYLARPTTSSNSDIHIGAKTDTSQAYSTAVAAVNHFRNAMGTSADYYLKSNGCAVITRKGGGAVIVKPSGGGNVTVENGGGYAKAGTYTDKVSGNTFTVTSSTISGDIGGSGIAVLFDGSIDGPIVSDTDTGTSTDTSTHSDTPATGVNVYFDNSSYNWSSVYAYVYNGDGESATSNAAWPGVKLTQTNSEGYLMLNVDSFKNGRIIFSDGTGSAQNRYPADMEPGLSIGGQSMLFGAGNSWNPHPDPVETDTSTPDTDTSTPDTDTSTHETDTSTPDTDTSTETTEDKISVLSGDANQDGAVTLRDASVALKSTVGKATFTGNGKTAADVDGSGDVTSADALAIQRYDIGIASNSIGKTIMAVKVA